MHVPFVDLRAQHASVRAEIDSAVREVLDRGDFILGGAVPKFEEEFAAFLGVRHAIAVGNGLDAITLALRGLGIGPGDEVITVANTFIASALGIIAAGARPVLVDADPKTHLIDPDAVAAAVTSRTRAILPVHLFGQPVDMDRLSAVARRHNLAVVEDAAQAHGARYNGRRAGTFGNAATFSFFPSKNLGACGDGGMTVTNDDQLADRLRMLRNYGQRVKYHHDVAGVNSRLDTIQAAILRIKLTRLDGWNAERRQHAAEFDAALNGVVTTPTASADVEHIYHLYVIESDGRDALQQQLKDAGIDTGIHYPVPVHLQKACADLGYRAGAFPVSERAAGRILSLPMYAEMSAAQRRHVTDSVARALHGVAR